MIPARAWIIPILCALVLVATCSRARAEPVNCTKVRDLVTHHGKFAAYAWALANGYSPKEISRIRKQCGV